MKHRSRAESPWFHCFEKDDRSYLKDFASQKWEPSYCFKKSKNLLLSMVPFLQHESYGRWGLSPDSFESEKLCMDFLTWLRDRGEWQNLVTLWQNSTGPWSLYYFYSRSFFRYKNSKPQPKKEPFSSEHTLSGIRSLAELPKGRMEVLASSLSEPFLDAFTSLSYKLPENIRLPYQLYLEGLFPEEIAFILSLDVKVVNKSIDEAKDFFVGDNRRYGT